MNLKRKLGGDSLSLRVSADKAAEALQLSGAEGNVERESGSLATLKLWVIDGPSELPRLLLRLAAAGIEVASASARRPSLDDVFLNLTGRSLREAGSDDQASSAKTEGAVQA